MTLRLQFVQYLMSSYLYYDCDSQVLTDPQYDQLCRELLAGWEQFDHQHKHLVTKEDLAAGTGYAIRKYPLILKSAAHQWERDSIK